MDSLGVVGWMDCLKFVTGMLLLNTVFKLFALSIPTQRISFLQLFFLRFCRNSRKFMVKLILKFFDFLNYRYWISLGSFDLFVEIFYFGFLSIC